MADTFLILYGEQQCSWCLVNNQTISSEIFTGTLLQAAAFHKNQKTIVLLDGLQCSYFLVDLPKTNKRKAIASIAYQLEEELSDDIDCLKFNYQKNPPAQSTGVVVINKEVIAKISSNLANAGINASAICPTFALMPKNSINLYKGVATCNIDELQQFSCHENLVAMMLQTSNTKQDDLATTDAHIFNLLAKQLDNIPFDLLDRQKDYASTKKHLLNWSLTAVLAVLILASYLFSIHLETQKIVKQADNHRQLSLQILKKAFPETKKNVRNPRVLMRSKMKRLSKQGNTSQFALTTLLFDVGNTLSDFKNITINSINANKSGIEIDIETAQLSEIDDIKKVLSERDGFTVSVSAISQNANGAKGRLRIKQ